MQNSFALIILVASLGSSPILMAREKYYEPMNESDILFSNDTPTPVSTCWISGSSTLDLSKSNITREHLQAGIPCLMGDFDGNGYIDFLFLEEPGHPQVFVFYEKDKLLRTQPLPISSAIPDPEVVRSKKRNIDYVRSTVVWAEVNKSSTSCWLFNKKCQLLEEQACEE